MEVVYLTFNPITWRTWVSLFDWVITLDVFDLGALTVTTLPTAWLSGSFDDTSPPRRQGSASWSGGVGFIEGPGLNLADFFFNSQDTSSLLGTNFLYLQSLNLCFSPNARDNKISCPYKTSGKVIKLTDIYAHRWLVNSGLSPRGPGLGCISWCGVWGGHIVSGTGLSTNTSVFLCQYKSTNAPYS